MYYVYAYFDPTSRLPFYIGKGKGNRKNEHLKEAAKAVSHDKNLHKLNKIRKLVNSGTAPVIRVIDGNLDEAVAFELEEFMVSWIGRADQNKGPLTNMSNGGEGVSGCPQYGAANPNFGKRGEKAIWWGRKHDEMTKEKIASAQRGRVFTEEHKSAMRKPKSAEGRAALALARRSSSYRPSEETRLKISVAGKGRPSALKGRTLSAEHKAKIGASGKGVPKPKVECPHCRQLGAMNVMSRFHFDNCKDRK